MNSEFLKSKIKTCLIGNGEWANKIKNVLTLIDRYELIGTIDTKTNTEEKEHLLNTADFWYIAVPPDSQMEYVKLGVSLRKHIICESPMLNSIEDRKVIYDLLIKNGQNNKIFYCNFPYFLDQDFAKIVSGGLIRKVKFMSIKCMGPRFKDNPKHAKKFYINQALNLIFNVSSFIDIKNFDNFIINDNFSGQLHAGNITFLFEWGYNEYPKLDLTVKGDDYSKSAELVYDKYDQIMPILINFSDKIFNITDEYASNLHRQISEQYGESLISRLSISSFMIASTAEYFSDAFVKADGNGVKINDPSKLFINGGFFDTNYSILNAR